MIFGSPSRFAIEVELHTDPAGIWMNGKSCYWISGSRVGDFDLIDSLRDVLFCWERVSYDKTRFDELLSHLDAQELIKILCCGLYNDNCDDQGVYQQKSIEGTWARYNINPGTVAFREWRIFLVESKSVARCLYVLSDDTLSQSREQNLQLGEFNQVLDDAIAYLLREYQRFGGV